MAETKAAVEKRKATLAAKKRQQAIVNKYDTLASSLPRNWFNDQGEAVALVKSMHVDIMGKDKQGNARSFNDLQYFLFQCAQRELNPFKGQIHAVYIWDSNVRAEKLVVITGIGGFRALAQRSKHPLYAGSGEPVWEFDSEKKLKRAKVHVYGYNPVTGAREIISTGVAWYDEYVKLVDEYGDNRQKTGRKKPNSTWEQRPKGMLAKCAEALALRQAFPEQVGDLYVRDEIDHMTDRPTEDAKSSDDEQREAIKEQLAKRRKDKSVFEGEVVEDGK